MQLTEIPAFFESKGGLHDARVEEICLSLAERALKLKVDDINSNFLGLPEYLGKEPVIIEFRDIKSMHCNFNLEKDKISIFEIVARPSTLAKEKYLDIDIQFYLYGTIKITCSGVLVGEWLESR